MAAHAQHPAPADLVLRNGAVYTVDSTKPWARAVAVRAGRIVLVGSDSEAAALVGARTRVIDLAGRMLLPGFHDSHVHPVSGGMEMAACDLGEQSTRSGVVETIARCSRDKPGASWLLGRGWQLPVFPAANPGRALLDSLVPDRPAFFVAADGHSAWVNSRALAIAGISAATPDPPRGHIERDSLTREPTGTLRESASRLVRRHLPRLTAADYEAGLARSLTMAARYGITSLQEASADTMVLRAYAALDRRGVLTARVVAAIRVDPAAGPAQVARMSALRTRFAGRRLRVTAAKIFADGVIEARTAALLEPYVGGGGRGTPNLTAPAMDSLVIALDRARFQVHVHAIGDGAVRMTLDAFAAAQRANGARDSRHHIAHLEMIDSADVPRFAGLGVYANFQPLWAYEDSYIRNLTVPVLGTERSRHLYPLGSIARSGAVLVAGSDWNVSSMDPLQAMQVAVTRRYRDSTAGPAWLPDEQVTLAQIMAAYTINGARVSFEEHETGSIAVGKAADLIVIDRNLFVIPSADIHRAKVLLTLLAGREIYRDRGAMP